VVRQRVNARFGEKFCNRFTNLLIQCAQPAQPQLCLPPRHRAPVRTAPSASVWL
jgi:hypothetical protein